ncbi:hypothetical protein J1N35_028292 [Gossypium stocksii]|uniref:RNase H type-1 domain-containing protein n=1 Tax=Gossypium stocksii TaxID=47602 RepID=A0A9D3UW33_9ROSI|nr:hypothetical protein J1N35_028292 [Gossypium stocksii]
MRRLEKWRAPRSSTVKINFDVAFNRQRKRSCLDVVIRNENGIVLGSKLVMHDNILTTFAAEAIACFQAFQLGLELQLSVVEIKGDAHWVVRKMQKEEDRSEIMPYIRDSKCLCAAIERLKREESTFLVNRVPPYVAEEAVTDQKWVEVMDDVEGSLNISL